MEITPEKLIAAATDLNNILKLEPPINATFATELKGGAAKAVEAKFVRGLQTEITQLAEYQDKETGKFDLQPGDLPLLQPETLEVIFEISPQTKERLSPPQEKVVEKKVKKEKTSKKSFPEKEFLKGRIESGVSSILKLGIETAIQNPNEAIQKADQEYVLVVGGNSSEKASKRAIERVLRVIKALLSNGYQIIKG